MNGITKLYHTGTYGSNIWFSGGPSRAKYMLRSDNTIEVYDEDLPHLTEVKNGHGDPILLVAADYRRWQAEGWSALRKPVEQTDEKPAIQGDMPSLLDSPKLKRLRKGDPA